MRVKGGEINSEHTLKDTEQPQQTNLPDLSWPLGGPPRMGAASAAYCALSAGSKPIEEVPAQRSCLPGRMGPGRPGMPGRT